MFILNRGTLGVFGEGKRIARVEETGGLYFWNLRGIALWFAKRHTPRARRWEQPRI